MAGQLAEIKSAAIALEAVAHAMEGAVPTDGAELEAWPAALRGDFVQYASVFFREVLLGGR